MGKHAFEILGKWMLTIWRSPNSNSRQQHTSWMWIRKTSKWKACSGWPSNIAELRTHSPSAWPQSSDGCWEQKTTMIDNLDSSTALCASMNNLDPPISRICGCLTFKQPVTLDPFQNMFIYYCFCRHLSGRLQQEASLGRMISQWLFLTSALNKWGKTVKHSSLKEYAS